jgi:hypothetical protein
MEVLGLHYDFETLLSVLGLFQWTITIVALLLWTLAGLYLMLERSDDTESIPRLPKR